MRRCRSGMMRLDKLLATLGAGTRSELRSVIRKGLAGTIILPNLFTIC